MVDTGDLKSPGSDPVPVRVRPPAPRQKKPTALRFRRPGESSVSVGSFFLSETGVSRGTPVSVITAGSDLDCSGAPRQNKAARSCGGTSTATSTGDLVFPFQLGGLAGDLRVGFWREVESVMNTRTKPTKSEPDLPYGRRVRILCFLQETVFSQRYALPTRVQAARPEKEEIKMIWRY